MGERQDGFKENVETPSVWSARPAELAAEEIRRTNAAGGVQNRPAEDGRVHVVEPRAREALKIFTPEGSIIPRLQTAEDLEGDDLLLHDAEIEVMNMILLSIPNEIYNYVDAYTSAKDMWKRVERLMRRTTQNKVDRETRFTNEFDQFIAEPGEALVFLQPEWLKYVTQVRLAKQLTVDSFDDLFDYLQQFEKLVNASRAKKLEKSHDPLALVAHTGSSSRQTSSYYVTHPTSVVDYDDEYQQDDVHNNSEDPLVSAMLLLAKAITQNFSNPTNNRLRASSNTRNQAIIQGDKVNIQSRNSSNTGRNSRRVYVQEEVVEGMNAPKETGNVQRTLRTLSLRNTSIVQCYNCGGKGHYARNCSKPRVCDSKYFMEHMLLAKQDDAGGHAEVPNPAFVNEKIRSIEANHLTVGVVLNLAISEISNHMIAETSIRSGNPPEQLVPNTKRKCDTADKIDNTVTLASTMWKMTLFKVVKVPKVNRLPCQWIGTPCLKRVVEVANVEDIGGLENVKQVLHEQVQDFPEPFFLKNREGETFAEVKVRIQKKLQIPPNKFSMLSFRIHSSAVLHTLGILMLSTLIYRVLCIPKDGSSHHLEDYHEISEVADITTGDCSLEMPKTLSRKVFCQPSEVPQDEGRSSSRRLISRRRLIGLKLASDIVIRWNTILASDIEKVYRLFARNVIMTVRYHPDVNKDSQAGEVFKGIRLAYEVLSNNLTRDQYDRSLQFQPSSGPPWRTYDIDIEDEIRIHRWSDLRQKMGQQKYQESRDSKERYYPFDDEADDEFEEDDSVNKERGSFLEVLKSAFVSIFLLKTIGAKLSLTFSSLMAMLDPELDGGYKAGYMVAWVLGGKSGIVLTLCLSFATWVCGKTSSNIVALVVVSMWVGSNLARFAPLPQGALLTLIYMSIKLQADLN
ncbi:DnaJ homolog subfamily C member 18 [Tanacetum coccineum]